MEPQCQCSLAGSEPIAAERPRPDVRFQRLRLSAILVGAGQEGTSSAGALAHEIAKLLLEYADSFLERTEAIKVAMSLGMTLREIEEYLDWLDASRPPRAEGRPARLSHREPRGRS
jgi:hypothetical protein